MVYLAQSAAAVQTQAMFVFGLMLSLELLACEATPWMQCTVEAGLQSARLAYVSNGIYGRGAACGVVLDADLMAGFLDAAAEQVLGYSENMLLGALRREFASLTSP